MILNSRQNKTVLEALEKSNYKFYLTGSKFFRPAASFRSDTDFFTSELVGLDTFLTSLGFRKVSSRYHDKNTLYVYRNLRERIDIQVCRNVEVKQRIQDLFIKLGILDPTSEQWNVAYDDIMGRLYT